MFSFHANQETVREAMTAHQARRAELVDAAWALFATQGYDATSVNAIIERVGVSKGTFYHYFQSKEDLLDAAVERVSQQFLGKLRPVIEDDNVPALQKLSRMLLASMAWKKSNFAALIEIARVMYRPENLRLRHKIQRKKVEQTSPMLAALIEQGLSEGVFDTKYPAEAAELLLEVGNALGDANAQALLEAAQQPQQLSGIERRMHMWFDALERILGIPRGQLLEQNSEMLAAVSETLAAFFPQTAAAGVATGS